MVYLIFFPIVKKKQQKKKTFAVTKFWTALKIIKLHATVLQNIKTNNWLSKRECTILSDKISWLISQPSYLFVQTQTLFTLCMKRVRLEVFLKKKLKYPDEWPNTITPHRFMHVKFLLYPTNFTDFDFKSLCQCAVNQMYDLALWRSTPLFSGICL